MTIERTTERGPQSVWAAIQSPPQLPVIADGLFQHYTRPAAIRPATWETDIQLPNITCAKCTLQVIQFMAEHGYNQPGGYSYHHCADLAITADSGQAARQGLAGADGHRELIAISRSVGRLGSRSPDLVQTSVNRAAFSVGDRRL